MSLDAIKILRKLASFLLFGLSVFPTIAASTASPSHYDRYSNEETAARLTTAVVGDFKVQWDASDPYLLVTSIHNPEKVLFKTIPSVPFVSVGFATDSSPPIVDGNYKVNEWTLYETPYQNIKGAHFEDDNTLKIYGDVWGMVTRASYELTFYTPQVPSSSSARNQLAFDLKVTPAMGTFNRLFLNYWSHEKENFYGFGTQFTYWNLKGRRVPIIVAEQGIGRGALGVTTALNILGDGAGGDWSTTYAPKPLYITNHNRAMIFENTEMMYFDTRDQHSVVVELWGNSLKGRILNGDSMLDLITEVTTITGRMKSLPRWTQEGAIAGLEGGTEEVSHLVDRLVKHNVPLSGVWLQDWVGLRHAYDGDRLQWNWQMNSEYYPQWNKMVDSWRDDHDIRVLTYINPFFSETEEGVSNPASGKRNLYREGIQNGYFVQSPRGGAYKMHSGSIEFCMLDTTNPAARVWMKEIMKKDMIEDSRSSGWMADFGEYLPFDAVLYGGQNAAEYHNVYPEAWAQINEEAVREAAEDRKARQESVKNHSAPSSSAKKIDEYDNHDVVYFMRSAGIRSPAHTTLFWLGDQLVSWDRHDGMKSVMVGALSSGVSGHSLTHSDIGGYTMQDSGPLPYIRSKELLLRWSELAAFGSAMFRTHVGSNTSPLNSQIYEDEDTMKHFGDFTRIFAELADYRMELMKEAEAKGWPLIRSMAAHYPEDTESWDITTQYMFGPDFLVAPVLDPATNPTATASKESRNGEKYATSPVPGVKVFVPSGSEWVHLWTGQVVSGGEKGRHVTVDAPVGHLPVFYTPSSVAGNRLRDFVVANGLDAVHRSKNVATLVDEEPLSVDVSIKANPLDAHLGTKKNESKTPSRRPTVSSSVPVAAPLSTVAIAVAHYDEATLAEETFEILIDELGLQLPVAAAVATTSPHLSTNAGPMPISAEAAAEIAAKAESHKAVIGDIVDFVPRDWLDWLGIKQYVSRWEETIGLTTAASSSSSIAAAVTAEAVKSSQAKGAAVAV